MRQFDGLGEDSKMNFSEWIEFEAGRIVSMGLRLPEDHRADYIRVQIQGALRKAFAHGRDGLTETDQPRLVSEIKTEVLPNSGRCLSLNLR